MPLSTIFQVYRGGQIYWRRKPEYLVNTTDMPQVTDKLSYTQICRIEGMIVILETMGGRTVYPSRAFELTPDF
jgi:hypothetical protein